MKRIQYFRYGNPEELRLDDVPVPEPEKGQILVKVKAASVNPMDWKIRRGEMKVLTGSRFPRGLGHDFAGVVEALGPDVTNLNVGDNVFGVTSIKRAGAFAEYTVAEAQHVALKPPSILFEDAAALTLVSMTAWNALVDSAKLKPGQTVFIAGCLGGVGRSAVQIARMHGANVVGSCNVSKRNEALLLGVEEAIDYRSFDVAQYRGRFDVVFDTAGALTLGKCSAILKRRGVSLHIVPTPAKMIGTLLSSRHRLVFGKPSPALMKSLSTAMERGRLTSAIGRRAPLTEAISAIVELERTGMPKGKLVIVPES